MSEEKAPISRSNSIYELSVTKVLETFKTSTPAGLNHDVAKARLEANGFNELEAKVTPKWRLFLNQFNNIVVYILIFAVGVNLFDATLFGLNCYYDCDCD